MKERSFGHRPVFMMLTLSVGLSAHVIVLPAVLDVSARDARLCGLLAFAIVIPWLTVFLYGSVKRTNVDLRIAFGVTAAIRLLSFKGLPKGGMQDDRTPQSAGAWMRRSSPSRNTPAFLS
ncbi:hypothetical protein SAMN02799624_03333 [Paenibacillus sp. UNC496MF]|uniref:hypothetical protein n=1 Tax=Paenibacillus sp. UNC496MF TaxID=1502753 RepID=UPI0008F313A4|nr:hypothetical protein [Paenibacillus sp. UNC496MF]SFJ11853.1 hypothetical protein SAMN02799624_03333 [Paenibacillus sp. UNC496MF]